MRRRGIAPWSALLAPLLLVACAGEPQEAAGPPRDPAIESGWQLARFAFAEGQYRQSVALYERVLALAFVRDDVVAIGDIGYEHALALLRNGEPAAAADQAVAIRRELVRRRRPAFAELFLVEAVARYEAGEPEAAGRAAIEAQRRAGADDRETRGRARFIQGMIAADAGDVAGVERSLAAMDGQGSELLEADKAVLRGRLGMLTGAARGALAAFENAAALRRSAHDYTGMARALAAAADAAEQAGDPAAAAGLYYRAGRSAAAQDDTTRARQWLDKALQLATSNRLIAIEIDARAGLEALPDGEAPARR